MGAETEAARAPIDVLVVEDDPSGRDALKRALERVGLAVKVVDSAITAATELRQYRPKAIVCDLILPFMNGLDFYRMLRRDYPELATRIVFVTAYAHTIPVKQFLDSTPQPYLTKPYDVDHLQRVVQTVVDNSPSERPRVLVLEDDQAQRRALARILGDEFQVDAVPNGIDAFEALRQRQYDAIISDIRMPYLGGRSFYEQLEESMPHMAGRVVFVTAWAHEPQTKKFLDTTGQPVVGKPYNVTDLADAVRKIASRPQ